MKTNSYIYSFDVRGLNNTIQSSLELIMNDELNASEIFKYIIKSAQEDVVKQLGTDFKDADIRFNFISLVNTK